MSGCRSRFSQVPDSTPMSPSPACHGLAQSRGGGSPSRSETALEESGYGIPSGNMSCRYAASFRACVASADFARCQESRRPTPRLVSRFSLLLHLEPPRRAANRNPPTRDRYSLRVGTDFPELDPLHGHRSRALRRDVRHAAHPLSGGLTCACRPYREDSEFRSGRAVPK